MPNLIMERYSEYSYKLRDYSIILDERQIGTISDGERKEFEISKVNHSIFIKMGTFANSFQILFEVMGNEEIATFKVGSSKYEQLKITPKKWNLWIGISLIPIIFILKFLFQIDFRKILLILVVLVLIIALISSRRKFLSISKTENIL